MPRYTTSQTYTDGNTQIVALSEGVGQLVPYAPQSSAIAEVLKDDEDLEVKLRRISEQVPVRISNTSGSSAGSGSGDFHQYRQMRRREQDRLARMDADYERRKEEAEFEIRREARLKAAEERTAKKRAKRQKKKERKKQKKAKPENNLLLTENKEGGNETGNSDSDDDNDDRPPSSQGRDCSHVD